MSSTKYRLAGPKPPRHNEFHHEVLVFTPETAGSWLTCNPSTNRSRRTQRIVALRGEMESGDYALNGETLKTTYPLSEGEIEDQPAGTVLILDGQHRLFALSGAVKGTRVAFLVVSGLAPKVRRTVDSGASRTLSDVLRMEKGLASPTLLAAITTKIYLINHGDTQLTSKEVIGRPTLVKFLETDPTIQRAAEVAYRIRYGPHPYLHLPPSVLGVAYYYTAAKSPEEAPWFFERIHYGNDLSRDHLPLDHPVMALRRRLEKDATTRGRVDFRVKYALLIRAWNAYREGKSLSSISHLPNAKIPDPI